MGGAEALGIDSSLLSSPFDVSLYLFYPTSYLNEDEDEKDEEKKEEEEEGKGF